MIALLEKNRTSTPTLAMINNIVNDPKYAQAFLQLRADERYLIGFDYQNYFYNYYISDSIIGRMTSQIILPIFSMEAKITTFANWLVGKKITEPAPQVPYIVRTKEVIFREITSSVEKNCDCAEFFYDYI